MRLDTWQRRVIVDALHMAAAARRESASNPRTGSRLRIADDLECKALESMAAALESGESLEVGT